MDTFAVEMNPTESSKGGRGKGEGENQSSPYPSPFTLYPSPQHAIGVLGGTFDPIHLGHLRMAEELADALNLKQVRFIPAGQPPHRLAPKTPAAHRLEMVRLATADNPRFSVDAREVMRDRASYTVDTLTDLRDELGTEPPLWLLLGADAFLGLPTWKNWRQLFELANIAVAHRPGYTLAQSDALNDALRTELEQRQVAAPTAAPAGGIMLQPITQLAISATGLRNQRAAGQSLRYLTPDCVSDYIEKHHLYLTA